MNAEYLVNIAYEIADAEAAVGRAELALAGAQEKRDVIATRLAVLASDRQAIVVRRAAGTESADDGQRLALIGADTEGLGSLLGQADAVVVVALKARQAAWGALSAAKSAYADGERAMNIEALDGHADRLLVLLGATLAERQTIATDLLPVQMAAGRIAARLESLDKLLSAELATLSGKNWREMGGAVPPLWKPSDTLHRNVLRLHHMEGRF